MRYRWWLCYRYIYYLLCWIFCLRQEVGWWDFRIACWQGQLCRSGWFTKGNEPNNSISYSSFNGFSTYIYTQLTMALGPRGAYLQLLVHSLHLRVWWQVDVMALSTGRISLSLLFTRMMVREWIILSFRATSTLRAIAPYLWIKLISWVTLARRFNLPSSYTMGLCLVAPELILMLSRLFLSKWLHKDTR
jgi:hypothetical protein